MSDLITILNGAGEGFYRFASAMLIQSSILIVLLYLIDLVIRRYVRAIFRYCVWMLVFVKLVLPPTLSLPTGVGYWGGAAVETISRQRAVDVPEQVTLEEAGPVISRSGLQLSEPVSFDEGHYVQPVEPVPSTAIGSEGGLTWRAILFVVWLMGVSILSVLLLQRFRFVKNLLARSDRVEGGAVELLGRCRQQVGLRRDIELRFSRNMLSPAACGLFRPIILMPAALLEKLSEEKLRAVLIHELVHIKRGDLWVNFIQTILQIVYFYNPLLWFANAVVRRVREKAVDEAVLASLGDEADSYGNTLIDIAEIAFSKPHFSLRLIGVVESKKALADRIRHILGRPFPKKAKLGLVGLTVIMVAAALLLPMAKTETPKPITQVPEPEPTVTLVYLALQPDILREAWDDSTIVWTPTGEVVDEVPELIRKSRFQANSPFSQYHGRPLRFWFYNEYHGIGLVGLSMSLMDLSNTMNISGAGSEAREPDADHGLSMASIALEKTDQGEEWEFPEYSDIQISYAVGDWETIAEFDTKGGTISEYVIDDGIRWVCEVTDERVSLSLIFDTSPDPDFIEYRQVVVGHEKRNFSTFGPTGDGGGKHTRFFELNRPSGPDINPSDLGLIQIQSRPRTSRIIKDVALRPKKENREPTVTLKYLSWQPENPSAPWDDPNILWTPTGEVVDEVPELLRKTRIHEKITWNPESISPLYFWFYTKCLELEALPISVRLVNFPTSPSYASSITMPFRREENADYGVTVMAMELRKGQAKKDPVFPEYSDIIIIYPVGDWETIAEFDTKGGTISEYVIDDGISWVCEVTDERLSLSLIFDTIPDDELIEYRQVIVGHEDKIPRSSHKLMGDYGIKRILYFDLNKPSGPDINPADLGLIQIQSRPRTSRTIKNVALRPDTKGG